MKIIRALFSVITWLVIGTAVLLAIFTLTSNISFAGGFRSLLVQSGSMEPAIMTGDIIIIQPQQQYLERDVITFLDESKRVVTHRIIKVVDNGDFFQTQGDANREQDEGLVARQNILGSVIFTIPKIGIFVAFAKSLPGFISLVIIPALLLIGNELMDLASNRNEQRS